MPISLLLGLLNFKKFIPFLLTNWKPILIISMAGLLAYQNLSGTRFLFGAETIPSLNMRLEAATKAINECKSGNDALSAAIDDRNAEVVKWKAITTNLENDIGILQKDLDTARVKLNAEVDVILKDETPKTCEASIDYLRDGRKDLKWDD